MVRVWWLDFVWQFPRLLDQLSKYYSGHYQVFVVFVRLFLLGPFCGFSPCLRRASLSLLQTTNVLLQTKTFSLLYLEYLKVQMSQLCFLSLAFSCNYCICLQSIYYFYWANAPVVSACFCHTTSSLAQASRFLPLSRNYQVF